MWRGVGWRISVIIVSLILLLKVVPLILLLRRRLAIAQVGLVLGTVIMPIGWTVIGFEMHRLAHLALTFYLIFVAVLPICQILLLVFFLLIPLLESMHLIVTQSTKIMSILFLFSYNRLQRTHIVGFWF